MHEASLADVQAIEEIVEQAPMPAVKATRKRAAIKVNKESKIKVQQEANNTTDLPKKAHSEPQNTVVATIKSSIKQGHKAMCTQGQIALNQCH